jgi:DUF2917 family protein
MSPARPAHPRTPRAQLRAVPSSAPVGKITIAAGERRGRRKSNMATANRTNPSSAPVAWKLAENAAMRVSRHGVAVVVRVDRGTVLVTRQGDVQDHVLEPGDELRVPRGGLAVAWAFTDATISVREARAA